ncbi:MAG: lipoate--protein ligase family protein [Candidatus Bipolaricaulota bacterium]|nr:lipoate--protein ligase family protein [Candidatus Bipolaricaulota bacterium]
MRLLDTGTHGAAMNMAIDEALLLLCDEKPKVTLRFYGWARPTLSLGYFQSVHEIDLEECERRGFDWVRRPTGGRAVLHDYELTYSVIAPIEVLGESIAQSHEKISRALAVGLEKLGLHAEFTQSRASVKEVSAACFAVPAAVELTVGGKKVIGSAQVRTKGSLLQHGSIPITIDFDALAAVLKIAQPDLLRKKAAGLAEFLGYEPSLDALKDALRQGFAEFFQVELQASELSHEEYALAEKLCTEKYATRAWNWGGKSKSEQAL